MKMPIADVADRYTILLLKGFGGLHIDEDLDAYEKELVGVDFDDLLNTNRKMWDLEEKISDESNVANKGSIDVWVIGSLYLQLRKLTSLRLIDKNKIAKDHGGPIERKTY